MCGITGAVSTRPVDTDLVERMRDLLVHRGPDAAGLWRSADRRVCLGHRRLAVVDLSPEANQPFVSGDGRYSLTYNGELYGFHRLREELGVPFRTSSDTEVLLEAYRAWGESCLDRLSGMFAFAIWDSVEQRLFCARDRAGEKPFYYALTGGSFVFASELKSLLLWPSLRTELDYEAVADFFVLGCVVDPRTIWRGVRKLEPGHSLTVELRDGSVTVGTPRQWWDLRLEPDRSVTDWRPEILETLTRVAGEMAQADVPVGAFLSGGVDSSSIVAAVARGGRPLSTFTSGFEAEPFDERRWARTVADRYAADHTESLVEPADVESVFPDWVLRHFEEPFNDHSYLPVLCVSRAAREAVTVALTGDGADELFAGYARYMELADGSYGEAHVLNSISAVTSEKELRPVARGPLADALETYSPTERIREFLHNAPPEEVGVVNSRRYVDLKLTLGGDLLVKVDRASMAVSLETRAVYLHRDMLDLARRIPPEVLADGSEAKKVLKAALEPWLPADLLYRKKQGFSMPLGTWFCNGLRPLLAGLEDESRPLYGLVDPRFVASTVDRHLRGDGDRSMGLHGFVLLDRWLERWA